MKKALFMIGLGTLEALIRKSEDIDRIKEFDKASKLIYTGWDFAYQGRNYAEKYNADAIVCESSILYTKPEEGWREGKAEKGISLFSDKDLEIVKGFNYKLLNKIYEKEPQSVLFSQANEKGVCYYINPPEKVRRGLKKFTSKEEVNAYAFEEILIKKAPKLKSAINISGPKKLELLEDNAENRYLIEKINAKYRTFKPYSLELENGKLKSLSLDVEQRKEWKFKDLENLIKDLWNKGLGILSITEYLRVAPQTDVCVDIFPRTKKQTWREAIDKAKLRGFDYIFFLSRNTGSEIPLLADIYREYGDRSYFFGPEDVSSGLQRVGVMPKKTVDEILKSITEILQKSPKST